MLYKWKTILFLVNNHNGPFEEGSVSSFSASLSITRFALTNVSSKLLANDLSASIWFFMSCCVSLNFIETSLSLTASFPFIVPEVSLHVFLFSFSCPFLVERVFLAGFSCFLGAIEDDFMELKVQLFASLRRCDRPVCGAKESFGKLM